MNYKREKIIVAKIVKTIAAYIIAVLAFNSTVHAFTIKVSVAQESVLEEAFNGALQVKHSTLLSDGSVDEYSLKSVSPVTTESALEDGIYIVDKGYGWIRGEEDFIEEGYASSGDRLSIVTTKTVGSSHSVNVRIGAGIKYEIVETTISLGYGYSWSNSKSISVGFRVEAPSNKELYARVYSVSRRWDTIQVSGGKIVAGTQSYEPYGSWLKKIEYINGSQVDINSFKETQVRRVTDGTTTTSQSRITTTAQRLLTDYEGQLIDDSEVVTLAENEINPEIAENIIHISEDGTTVLDNNVDPSMFDQDSTSKSASYLLDGYYAIDYGPYWISPNDAGVIHTFVIPKNATAVYQEKVTASANNSTDVSYNLKISTGIVLFTLNAVYAHSWQSSYTESLYLQINSTENESAFAKVYSVNQRVDIVQVKNGKIVARNISYTPQGFKSEKMYYTEEQGCDQKKLYVTEPYSIFGQSESSGVGVIPMDSNALEFSVANFTTSTAASFEQNTPVIFSNSSTGTVPQIVRRFTVSHSGIYDIGYYLQQATYVYLAQNYSGWVGTWTLYEANSPGSKLGMKIAEVTTTPAIVVATNKFDKLKSESGFDYFSGYSNGIATKSIVLEAGKEYVFVIQSNSFLGNYVSNGSKSFSTNLCIVGRKKSSSVRKSNVSFFTNNGTAVPMQTITLGRTIAQAPVSTRSNMELEGWYYNMNLTDKFNFGIDIISQATLGLYARWVNEIYSGLKYIDKVNINSTSGNGIFNHSGDYEIIQNSAYDGNTAIKLKNNGSTTFTFKGDQFEMYGDYAEDFYRVKITIDGKEISEQPYLKTSNPSKGNLIYRSQVLSHGGEHVVKIEPIDGSVIIDYVRIIQIVADTYTVKYDLAGGSGNIPEQTVAANLTISAPTNTPTKTGYIFGGWYLDEEGTNPVDFSTLRINYNTTIYATWKELDRYILTFDLNGGEGSIENQNVRIGDTAQEPTTKPERKGYTFAGWYFDVEGINKVNFKNFMLEKDTTLYAKWTPLPVYKVTFDLNGGTGEISSQSVYSGDGIQRPSIKPTKEGYEFVDWYTDKSLTVLLDPNNFKVTKNTTIYARWKSNNVILVKFQLNGGSGNFPDIEIEPREKITVFQTPIRSGYAFNGWYEDQGLTVAVDLSEKTFVNTTTLYASWKIPGASYTIYFDLQNSLASVTPKRQTIPVGHKVEEPVVTPAPGYEFDGWYLEKAYVNKVDFNTWVPTKDTLLYVKWKLTY